MIFVTVGTHEQQFDRLIMAVDNLAASGFITDDVLIQIGYSNYKPSHCEWQEFIPAMNMKDNMLRADVVITHGGPSSFIEAMAMKKTPIVVPRRVEFGEHVNNHQVGFVRAVSEKQGGIIPCFEIENLPHCIEVAKESSGMTQFKSHNSEFCLALKALIEKL